MPRDNGFDVAKLVEPDRVHRACYTDEQIFERELEQIFHKTWIYVGHTTQVKQAGDYCTTRIGSQPMIMVRGKDGAIHVLHAVWSGDDLVITLSANTTADRDVSWMVDGR